jgi:hypothetical protein
MAIQYDIKAEGHGIYVKATGFDESLAEAQAYGQAVINACREHQCTHVLADERQLEYRLTTLDTYELAKYYLSVIPNLVKAAVVCNPDNLPDGEFWETATRNRGLTVRVFTEMDEARRWLEI